ncbi:PRC-barrel domain-containing protein [Sphingobacterium faecale]|uniref:PRC-barrel domain-containing protein n=1 Tax=Sphingobacterium faecale TaxID=2803775 RepID=A0ABS1R2Q0_9SPHI|nr:PRC-barrel domain-containing protein [Sphingobacterium faecale]MBL1408979.1 PRC-barrel domain-containing protein [Sphingobacterium faecale]
MEHQEIRNNHLIELTGSDYEIVDAEPDIRGWDVKDLQGKKIGEVDELLFDEVSQLVRYIVIEVDYDNYSAGLEKQILIPIGIATFSKEETNEVDHTPSAIVDDSVHPENIPLHDGSKVTYDPDADVVVVPITLQQVMQLPSYDPDFVSPSDEIAIRKVLENTAVQNFVITAGDYDPEVFYDHPHFNGQRLSNIGRIGPGHY